MSMLVALPAFPLGMVQVLETVFAFSLYQTQMQNSVIKASKAAFSRKRLQNELLLIPTEMSFSLHLMEAAVFTFGVFSNRLTKICCIWL